MGSWVLSGSCVPFFRYAPISWLVSHEIHIDIQYLFKQKKIKSSRKNMSYERAFESDQWKTFSENYKPMRVWLWLAYKIYRELLSLATFLRVHSNSKEVSYLSWQNRYPNLKITCHIKLKLFLWTKLVENLLHAKYFISVAAPLIKPRQIKKLLINHY